jgi:hypothetical protein
MTASLETCPREPKVVHEREFVAAGRINSTMATQALPRKGLPNR